MEINNIEILAAFVVYLSVMVTIGFCIINGRQQ